MNSETLRELAKSGKLIIRRYVHGTYLRNKYVYSATEGETIAGTFYGDLDKIIEVPYKRYFYSARTSDMPEHRNYKITAKDFKTFLSLGAKQKLDIV